jgi:hypothetical protein
MGDHVTVQECPVCTPLVERPPSTLLDIQVWAGARTAFEMEWSTAHNYVLQEISESK